MSWVAISLVKSERRGFAGWSIVKQTMLGYAASRGRVCQELVDEIGKQTFHRALDFCLLPLNSPAVNKPISLLHPLLTV